MWKAVASVKPVGAPLPVIFQRMRRAVQLRLVLLDISALFVTDNVQERRTVFVVVTVGAVMVLVAVGSVSVKWASAATGARYHVLVAGHQ